MRSLAATGHITHSCTIDRQTATENVPVLEKPLNMLIEANIIAHGGHKSTNETSL